MVKCILLLLVISIPGIAYAQQTTTRCSSIGGTVTCNSTTNPSLGDVIAEDAKRREKVDERRAESLEAATTEVARFAEQQRKSLLRKNVGQLVAEGRCQEAKNMALENGEIELASATKNLCE